MYRVPNFQVTNGSRVRLRNPEAEWLSIEGTVNMVAATRYPDMLDVVVTWTDDRNRERINRVTDLETMSNGWEWEPVRWTLNAAGRMVLIQRRNITTHATIRYRVRADEVARVVDEFHGTDRGETVAMFDDNRWRSAAWAKRGDLRSMTLGWGQR